MIWGIIVLSLCVIAMLYILIKNRSYNIKSAKKTEPVKEENVAEPPQAKLATTKTDDGKVVVSQQVVQKSSHQIDNISWNEQIEAEKHLEVLKEMEEAKKVQEKSNEEPVSQEVPQEKNVLIEQLQELSPQMKSVILADILNNKKF